MERYMLILMPLLTVYSSLQFHYLDSWSCHIYEFISYLILDTPCTFSKLLTLPSCKLHTSSNKPESDVQPSDQTCQSIAF